MQQWTDIRRRVLIEGVSKREILRETGIHWTTLEKILSHNVLHTYVAFKDRIRERGAATPEEAEAIIVSIAKKPLGEVIRLSEGASVLSEQLQKRVATFNVERRWLVHWSVVEKNNSLVFDQKHEAFLDRVWRYGEEAKSLHKAIATEYENFVVSKGVSRAWIDKKAQELFAAMKGKKS